MPTITSPFCRPEEDPVLLVESCYKSIHWLLRRYEGQVLRRTWIEQPYGEEELTRQEQEVLPAMEGFLQRMQEIDAQLLAAQDAEAATFEASMAEAAQLEPAVA
jgi:hypothetical protein